MCEFPVKIDRKREASGMNTLCKLLAVWLLSLAAALSYGETHYRVLLVGLGAYSDSDFAPLRGADDMVRIREVLQAAWKVPADSITVLTSAKDTTKQAILGAIQTRLIDPAQPGDAILFVFSGHGTQVLDPSKPTGVSQAIVPVDLKRVSKDDPARGLQKGEVDPTSLITGPEIGKLFDPLKAKGVVNVTLIFDSCHSGSITRGTCVAKGVSNPTVERFLKSKGQATAQPISQDVRGLVSISAARADQVAWQSAQGGNLSVALVQALRDAVPHESYRSLFEEVQALMASLPQGAPQNPVIEGDENRAVFADTFVQSASYFPVVVKDDVITVNAGEALGLKLGYTLGLYPAKTDDFSAAPKWTAVVSQVQAGTSELKLSDDSAKALGGDLSGLQSAEAVLLDGSDDGVLRVCATDLAGPVSAADLGAVPMVRLDSPATAYDVRLSPNSTAKTIDLLGPAGETLDSVSGDGPKDQLVKSLREALETQARKRAVIRLGPSEKSEVKVEMRLVRVRLDLPNDIEHAKVAELSKDGIDPGEVAGPKDLFAIQLRATGMTGDAGVYDPYIALLNVNPRPSEGAHSVQQIWPAGVDAHGNVEMRRLKADGSVRYLGVGGELVSGDDPSAVAWFQQDPSTDGVGQEIWKVFATAEPQDFGPLLDPSRSAAKGASTRLGAIMRGFATLQPVGRGAMGGQSSTQWAVAQVALRTK